MTRTTLAAATATLALLLTGCGSDSDAGSDPEASPDAASAAAPNPTAAPTKAAPEATTPIPTIAPEETTATPTTTLLDYETGDDEGVVLASGSDVANLIGAPADFTTFIKAELASATPGDGCTEAPQIYVTRIDTGGWARGGYSIPQCGGYATLWAKAGGAWKEIWSGQSLVECTTLTQFKIPARVAGSSCLKGEETVNYAG